MQWPTRWASGRIPPLGYIGKRLALSSAAWVHPGAVRSSTVCFMAAVGFAAVVGFVAAVGFAAAVDVVAAVGFAIHEDFQRIRGDRHY